MSTEHVHTPEPTGDPTYSDPLLEWIGSKVRTEWAGKEIEAVVADVERGHAQHRFSGELKLATGTGVTICVSPEHVEQL